MLATMFLLRKCSHDEVSPFAPQKGHSGGDTIDVAIEVSPVCYSLAGDTATGLDYEMVKDLSQYLNRPVKFHPFAPLQYALDGLEAGRYDIVVSSLPSTVEMKQRFPSPVHRQAGAGTASGRGFTASCQEPAATRRRHGVGAGTVAVRSPHKQPCQGDRRHDNSDGRPVIFIGTAFHPGCAGRGETGCGQ